MRMRCSSAVTHQRGQDVMCVGESVGILPHRPLGFSQNPQHLRSCQPPQAVHLPDPSEKKNQKRDFTASRHEKRPVASVSVTCALTRWLPDVVQLTERKEGDRPFPWIKSITLSCECRGEKFEQIQEPFKPSRGREATGDRCKPNTSVKKIAFKATVDTLKNYCNCFETCSRMA